MARLLITGGCGFVGRELTRRSLSHFEVHVLDNLRSGPHRLRGMPATGFTLHEADIRDAEAVRRVVHLTQPDVIAHLAAVHFIPECESQPDLALSTNVLGTVNVLSAAARGSRVITISSAAVYAAVPTPLDEATTAVEPMDVYGWTKAQGEEWTRYFAARSGFEGWSVRLFNVIGPGETNPHLVPEMVQQLRQGAMTLRVGNIDPKRDFIDVGDAADGLLRLALAPVGALGSEPGGAVNLGTGTAHSVREILDCLATVCGRAFTIESDPARVRAVDRPVLLASTERLRRVIGWVPGTPLKETVARIWAERPDTEPGGT